MTWPLPQSASCVARSSLFKGYIIYEEKCFLERGKVFHLQFDVVYSVKAAEGQKPTEVELLMFIVEEVNMHFNK